MNALADALKPLAASGPRLLAALAQIQDVSDREAIAEAVGAALAEQVSSRVAAANAAAASSKENASVAAAAAPAAAPAPPANQSTSLDGAAAIMRGVSFTQPWGSFDVAFFPGDKLVLRSAQKAGGGPASAAANNVKELVVPVSSVRAVAVLDTVPEEQAAFVLLGLKPAVAVPWASAAMVASGAGSLDCLAVRIPNSAPSEALSFEGNPAPIQGNRAIVLCAALGKAGVPPAAFLAPDPAVFANAAALANGNGGSGGNGCSVRAAVKASQGHLFPLGDRAIAFVKKPAFLVSLRSLRAAELARAGGGSASFDLLLHLGATAAGGGGESGGKEEAARKKVLEFSQIPRQELAPLRKWLEERGVPLGASAEEGAGGGRGRKKRKADAEEEESDDSDDDDEEASTSDDEDDEDFDPKAAAAELKAQEEAEKAEDEEEEEAGESSSGDDDEEDKDRPEKKNKF